MDHFGARYAGLDVYNILSTAVDVDELMGLLAALPGEKLAEALYDGKTSMGPVLAAQTAIKSYGYWRQIIDFYKTKQLAEELIDHYGRYPQSPDAMAGWQRQRDQLLDRIYETTGAEPKY